MRIIEDKTETITVCRRCGSKFAYSKKDIYVKIRPIKHLSPDPGNCEYYISCPCCKNYIVIPEEDVQNYKR